MNAKNLIQANTRNILIVAALGYFVDIYDLVLFSIVRVPSLKSMGLSSNELLSQGITLINAQMIGMLLGGILWGLMGDKKGRVSVLFGSILLYSLANIANAFVQNVDQYILIRFIAGIGLAGELGAGITLVSETMSKEKRGYGTMLVAGIGLLGAVFAALIAEVSTWQNAYLIGGFLGLALLVLRMGVYDSSMFKQMEGKNISRGSFATIFLKQSNRSKYIYCILLGLPVWFSIAIPVTFSPEFGAALGINETLSAGKAIMYAYIGLAFGDIASGVLSQYLRSRKKVLYIFIVLSFITVSWTFYSSISNHVQWYFACAMLGFAAGFWALFVTIAAEQFGTNVRATVTTTVPNFVRAGVVPITLTFSTLKGYVGLVNSAYIVAILCILLALLSAWKLPETFGKDLDYIER